MKLKFYMMFNNGEAKIRTLADLRNNFVIEDVLTHYHDGKLERWLDAWGHREELQAVKELKASGKTGARDVLEELMKIFDADMDVSELDEELAVYDYVEERKEFWEYVRTSGLLELEGLRKRCNDLEAERDKLQKERDKFRRDSGKFKRKHEQLKEEHDGLQEELTQLMKSLNNIQGEVQKAIHALFEVVSQIVSRTVEDNDEFFYDPEACKARIPPAPHVARFVFEHFIGWADYEGYYDEDFRNNIMLVRLCRIRDSIGNLIESE